MAFPVEVPAAVGWFMKWALLLELADGPQKGILHSLSQCTINQIFHVLKQLGPFWVSHGGLT